MMKVVKKLSLIVAALSALSACTSYPTAPRILTLDEIDIALESADQLEQMAQEKYEYADYIKVPNDFTFTIELEQNTTTLLWVWGWCATDDAILAENLGTIDLTFVMNGQDVSNENFLKVDFPSAGLHCAAYIAGLTDWQAGETVAVTIVNFSVPINDGMYDYPAGTQTYTYYVNFKP